MAAVPPKLTAVAPVKLVPLMVTVVPAAADVGLKEVTVGGLIKVKPPKLAVPEGVVTETLPEAPAPTTAEIVVELMMVNEVAAVPPKLTELAQDKFVPVMITTPEVESDVGVNDEMVGAAAVLVNVATDVAVLTGLVTDTVPEPPQGTTAVMLVALTALNVVAATPPKLTAEAQVKFVPVMVTVVPGAAAVGVNEVTVGAETVYVKPAKLPVPYWLVTETLPEAEPQATTAAIVVALVTVKDVAAVPPKLTAVAEQKLLPVMVTVLPADAVVAVNDVTVGADVFAVNINPLK